MYKHLIISVSCPALEYFSKLSHKRDDFQKKTLLKKKCFDFLYKFYLKYFSFQLEFSQIS
jgi:hypothetical protein